jgi:hypothetical protein
MKEQCQGCLKIEKCPPLDNCPCMYCVVKVMCSDSCHEYIERRDNFWRGEFRKLFQDSKSKIETKQFSIEFNWILIDELDLIKKGKK